MFCQALKEKEIGGMEHLSESSRRDFLKGSVTAASGALVSGLCLATGVHAAGAERFNIALIGAGNRGTGAAADCLNVGKHFLEQCYFSLRPCAFDRFLLCHRMTPFASMFL